MALTYKATFKPEKRRYKETGELIETNVPLMLDLSYQGRCWYNTGIRLFDINDFDIVKQKLKSGKKALKNKQPTSATIINNDLDNIKGNIATAFNTGIALKKDVTAKFLIYEMQILSGNRKSEEDKEKDVFWIQDFSEIPENWHKQGIIGLSRYKHFSGCSRILERFLKVNKQLKLKTSYVDADVIRSLRDFVINEYTYIDKHPEIYELLKGNKKPKDQKRNQNTVANILSAFHVFFEQLEEMDKIKINPFNKIPKREREAMLREYYDEPIYLYLNELEKIIEYECPESLQRVKDCFLLHCSIGCRVEDFNNLTWDNIRIENNFYYIHYVAGKTSHGKTLKAQDTPLVKFAVDIIEKYKDELPDMLVPNFTGNVTGRNGYNKQIKKLLEICDIDRGVIIRNDKGEMETVSIYSIASSKLARSTHVDITAKVALKKNISGLHADKSKAVNRYTSINIKERFELYCTAFNQQEYTISKTLL